MCVTIVVTRGEDSQMGADVRPIHNAAGCLHTWCGLAMLLALLAGCAEPPKNDKPTTSPPPEQKKSTPVKSSTPSATPAAQQTHAIATPGQSVPTGHANDESTGQATTAPQPVPVGADEKPLEFGPDTKLATEADREALAKLILAQAIAAQKANEQQPPDTGATPTAQPAPAVTQEKKPAQAAAPPQVPGSQPAAKPGCGATSTSPVDLTPPAPDQPQPKLVIKETKVKADKVWGGQQAVFKFPLSNEGEGPLAIRLRGG